MDTRLQHIFLKPLAGAIFAACLTLASPGLGAAEDKPKLKANSELFDFGLTFGTMSIEDFPTEFVYGANLTFKASEDFFLQYNYVTSDISESSWEAGANLNFNLGDRKFNHFDLLIGYNIFQGEFFASDGDAHISNLYVIGGVGETALGDEDNFSYTLGIGYQVEFYRRFLVRFDYRDYFFKSSLVVDSGEDRLHNTQMSLGVGYLF